MANKIVLITGCSSGIGLETAIKFGKEGYKVYATSRNIEDKKGDALRERIKSEKLENVKLLNLDVTKPKEVTDAIKTVFDTEGRLDIVINNAGYGLQKCVQNATLEEVQQQFDVNYMGVVRVLKSVIPIMRKQKSGRIGIVTSIVGFQSFVLNPHYVASKHALEGLIKSSAPNLLEFGINLFSFYPGPVATSFMQNSTHDEKKDAYTEMHANYFSHFAEEMMKNMQTSQSCGEELYKVSTQETIKGTRYASNEWVQKFVLPKISYDIHGEKELEQNSNSLKPIKKDGKVKRVIFQKDGIKVQYV